MKSVLVAFNARYSHSSLAIRYIKSYNPDLDIELAEYSINDNIYASYSSLLRKNADVYGFSVYIWNVEVTVKVAQMLKKAKPDATIVFGGPECSHCASELFSKHDFLDFVIMGEGEVATGKLLKALENDGDTKIQGVASRVYIGNMAECVPLDKIPLPYTKDSLCEIKNKIVYFETSRGCPFSCSYCLSSIEKGVRYFPMDYVKSGFDLFFACETPLVKLIDRTFNADPKRAIEIIEYIIKNSKCTKVHFEIDPAILTDQLIDVLMSAPKDMFQLEMGIQTANPKTLKAINRNENLQKAKDNIQKLMSVQNMHIHLDLIAGLPYEDYKSFENSFNYVYSMKPHMLQLGFLKVLHGTPIKQHQGIAYADFPPYEVIRTDWISSKEICKLKLIDKTVDAINNSGAFVRTLDKITPDNPFKVFEKLSQIFDTEKTLSRFDLYDEIYNIFGDSIKTELVMDFIESCKDRPMPKFANIKYPKNFKKDCVKLLEDEDFCKKYNINKDDQSLRFEPYGDKIFMMDYKNKKLYEI